jgi:2',3'-cyclic-nucleotide 2'-phosphodiesterase
MKILYIGDIMAKPGRAVVRSVLPGLRQERGIDFVIAQAENVSHGIGMAHQHMQELQECGVDFFSGGNHTVERIASHALLSDPQQPIIAPLNMNDSQEGWGAKAAQTPQGSVFGISLLGDIVPRSIPMTNPLVAVDEVLARNNLEKHAAIVVNFHGDYSSQKRVVGYYLDGKVTAVIGDHWHVPTADSMVLPKGTAHITDVGMCGTLHSSLGVKLDTIIQRWRYGKVNKNEMDEEGPYQFNAVLITVSKTTHLAESIEPINMVLEALE